jgi:hypothetical protein
MAPSGCLAISRPLLVSLAVGASACGDALMGADYQGEPLMILAGQVITEAALPELSGEVRVALFWSSHGGHGQQHEQQVAVNTSFPSRYELHLYTTPPDEVLYQPPHAPGSVGIAVPMLYEDTDGDGQYHSSVDRVLGGAQDVLVFYNSETMHPAPPPEDDTGRPGPDDTGRGGEPSGSLEPGYHAVRELERSCDDGHLVLSLAEPAEVALVVGELWEMLNDMDCDGELGEWEGL